MFTVEFKPIEDFVPRTGRSIEVFLFDGWNRQFRTETMYCEIHYQLRDLCDGSYYPSSCGISSKIEEDGIPYGKPVKFVDGKAVLLSEEELNNIKYKEKPYVWVKDWFLIGRNNLQIDSTDPDNQVIGWIDAEEYLSPIKNRCEELVEKKTRSYEERDIGWCKVEGCSGSFIIKKEGELKGCCDNPFCRDYKIVKPLSESYLKHGAKDERYYYKKIKQILEEDKEGKLSLQEVINLFQAAFNIKIAKEDLEKFLKEK